MIEADLQSLTPGALVELFTLDTTGIGGGMVYRFHAGVNGLGADLVWGGETYVRYPIESSGWERRSNGTLPRPKIKVANIDGSIGALAKELADLVGARLTRVVTLAKYLDAVNFPGGENPHADPLQYVSREVFEVARRSSENRVFVEFELAASCDLAGRKVPRRQYIRNVCQWLAIGGYRGPYCGYTAGPVADRNDQLVTSLAEDKCGGRLASCKLRWGEHAPLPYGGFPGTGVTR